MRRKLTPRPWLTELREQKGMSVTDLAVAVDVTDIYIRYIERGHSRPSPPLAIRIGEALGLSETEALLKFYSQKSA